MFQRDLIQRDSKLPNLVSSRTQNRPLLAVAGMVEMCDSNLLDSSQKVK